MWRIACLMLFVFCGVQGDEPTLNPEYAAELNSVYKHSVPTITIGELKVLIKQGAVLLDTREQEEFEVSHVKHARHVGYIWFDMRKVYDIPKTDTIVVYCAIGNRSERIGEKLQKAGYQYVYNLYGGIYEWVNQRNPVYNPSNIQTTEIHIYNKDWVQWLQQGTRVY